MPQPHPTWSRIGGVLVSVALASSALTPGLALAETTAANKSETVHVSTAPSGQVSAVTVEDLLTDIPGTTVEDLSSLQGIVSKDDSDTFAQSGEQLVWTTDDGEVTYEGSSEQPLPVEIAIDYTLDGKKVAPEQLAGASGHLVVRISYKNTSTQQCTIDGKQETVYTPFVCMSAVLLDSKVFSNVQATNARVIEDKGGLAVVGIALPGLRESLGPDVDELDVDIPEYVEFSADVQDLALDPIYTIVTPELFDNLDASSVDTDLGDLDEGSDALSEAMGELIEGSDALSGALGQLADGSGQLGGGMVELKKQLGLLPDGIAALSEGASALSQGLGVATTVAGQLADGASSVKDGAAAAKALADGAQGSLSGTKGALDEAQSALDGLDGAVTDATTAKDAAQGVASATASANEQLEGVADGLSTAQGGVDGAQAVLEGLTDEQREALGDSFTVLEEQLATAEGGVSAAQTAQTEAAGQLATAAEAAETLGNAATQLDTVASAASTAHSKVEAAQTATTEAQQGLGAAQGALGPLADGASGLSDGASSLSGQLGQASGGAETLATQLSNLSSQAPLLLTGVDALGTGLDQLTTALSTTADGSLQLTSGLKTFNDEGISELVGSLKDFSSSLDDASDRMDALRDTAKAYDTFAGKAEGQQGSVRFIYKTEAIG